MNQPSINDDAIYDTLFILSRLEGNFTFYPNDAIVSIFSYLACLMSIFDKTPYSSWGYRYHLTNGEISSMAIIESIEYLQQKNLIDYYSFESGYKINSNGKKFLSILDGGIKHRIRRKYLRNSADLVVLSDLKTILAGIYQTPDISYPSERSSAKPVLSETAQHEMYNSLNEIALSIGINKNDLILSTISWINYKAEENRIEKKRLENEG